MSQLGILSEYESNEGDAVFHFGVQTARGSHYITAKTLNELQQKISLLGVQLTSLVSDHASEPEPEPEQEAATKKAGGGKKSGGKKKEQAEPEPEPEPETGGGKEEEEGAKIDDVRAAAKKLMAEKDSGVVKQILSDNFVQEDGESAVTKVSELMEEDYAGAVNALSHALDG